MILAAAVAFVVLLVLFVLFTDRLFQPIPPRATRTVMLYLSDETGKRLTAVRHTIPRASLKEELQSTLRALIAPPKPPPVRTIPEGVRLISVDVRDGTAYVNFSSELVRNHPGGSSAELQTIYSIVNTVVLNFPQIKAVQILIEGKPQKTLKGHIIIKLPLGANQKLIAR